MGYEVVAADYNESAIGKITANFSALADTFSILDIQDCAEKYHVDGILTMGTDQPVLTVACVAERLNLPRLISPEVAKNVTNKKNMKLKFAQYDIPTPEFAFIHRQFEKTQIDHLTPPYVVKPIDSQGQRGIFKCQTIEEVRLRMPEVLSFSRADEILIESFYENDEITVSGWIEDDVVTILTVTDRLTFRYDEPLGVCTAHHGPSKHMSFYHTQIKAITEKICHGFDIKKGPIYFQYLIGNEGIKVNEIACRIGGAYEDVTIPWYAGIDILQRNIEVIIDYPQMDKNILKKEIDILKEEERCFQTDLFFCHPGKIAEMQSLEQIMQYDFVLQAGYYYNVGDEIISVKNASQRAGYLIVTGENEARLKNNLEVIHSKMWIKDDRGHNLIMTF